MPAVAVAVAPAPAVALAPPPPAPAPSAPATDAIAFADAPWDAPGRWDEVVAQVKDRKILVGVFLAEIRRAGWEGTTLKLAADEVHKSLLEARENRELLAQVMARVYGRPLAVRFIDGADLPAAPAATEPVPRVTLVEPEIERAEEVKSVAEEAARAPSPEAAMSPEVQQAMVWFEGEIVRRADSGGVHP
jgi:hypothetical protein